VRERPDSGARCFLGLGDCYARYRVFAYACSVAVLCHGSVESTNEGVQSAGFLATSSHESFQLGAIHVAPK
jgi:hypothetical protein